MISPEILRRFPFFYGFTDAQLKALAMIAEERDLSADTAIFEEGNPAQKFYLLVDGSIDLYIKSEEENNPGSRRDFPVGEINPGEVFGIATLFEPYVFSVTTRSANASKLIEFDGPSLRALTQVDLSLAYQLMQQSARTLLGRLNSTRVQLAAAWA